jgi:hypothetical protein
MSAQGEAEDLAVEIERLVDVADFERDMIDADKAGQIGRHGTLQLRPPRGLKGAGGGARPLLNVGLRSGNGKLPPGGHRHCQL